MILATKAYGLDDVLPGIVAAQPAEVVSFLNGVEHMAPLREALPGVPGRGRVRRGLRAARIHHGDRPPQPVRPHRGAGGRRRLRVRAAR